MDAGRLYRRLLQHYGPQDWWPAEHPFEVMVGAVLVQNTTWTNAERAVARLREARCLSLEWLAELSDADLAELIRASGTFRVKATRLKNLATALRDGGGLDALDVMSTEDARRFLLRISGVGAETADAILVYALGRPAFVVDAYARRLMQRLTGHQPSDERLRGETTAALPDSAALGELHALIVAHGKLHCGSQPRCNGCPLAAVCTTAEKTRQADARQSAEKPSADTLRR